MDGAAIDEQPSGGALRELARALAGDRRDDLLEATHTCLVRVAVDQLRDRVVSERDVEVVNEAVLADLLRHEIALRDLDLVLFDVAGQLDDFHAIAQRLGNRVEHVGGRDEHHARQIEREIEVVIAERVVLLGIEHLEQRGRRIALDVVCELVDLVEHEHRIGGAGAAHRPQDLTGHRADVRAPVAADLGLVADAAQ